MKRFLLLFPLFVLLLSACETASPAAPTAIPLPVIQVDAAHMTTVNLAYEIPAGQGFVLNASNYDFGLPGGPTAIQVVMKGRVYQAEWTSGASSQSVLASDLKPLAGSSQLAGFSTGQQLIISIGTLKTDGRFVPKWAAVVNIR